MVVHELSARRLQRCSNNVGADDRKAIAALLAEVQAAQVILKLVDFRLLEVEAAAQANA